MGRVTPRGLAVPPVLARPLSLAFAQPRSPAGPPGADALLADVTALAAPEMEGRGSGTPGNERAARYIADRLAALGVQPGGDDGTFFQRFAVSQGMRIAAGTELEWLGPPPGHLET